MAKQKAGIDPNLIRELAQLLEETGLSEIEVERDGQRVRVARQVKDTQAQPSRPPVAESPPMSPAPSEAAFCACHGVWESRIGVARFTTVRASR